MIRSMTLGLHPTFRDLAFIHWVPVLQSKLALLALEDAFYLRLTSLFPHRFCQSQNARGDPPPF